MFLTDNEKEMLDGEYGASVQKAMKLLLRYGEAFDAERMVRATSAHVSAERPEPLVTDMTEGVTTSILVTTHAKDGSPKLAVELGLLDKEQGQEMITQQANSVAAAVHSGFLPTYTCAPYLVGNILKPGEVASWCGSSGVLVANSWFGARLNRDGTTACIASAVTERLPYMGLLVPENRRGQLLVKLDNIDVTNLAEAEYGALGYYIGGIANDKNVVIDGLPQNTILDQAKYLFSPLSVSGAVGLCHLVGITPEATTLEAAFNNEKPEETLAIGKRELEEAWGSLSTASGDDVDIVIFGCPHFSLGEIKHLASLLEGKRVHDNVDLLIGTATGIYSIAKDAGYIDIIEAAGGRFDNSCLSSYNVFLQYGKKVYRNGATNSARLAHYAPRESKLRMFYGTAENCIDAATTGKWRGK